MSKTGIDSIVVIGRRWFDGYSGYCSAMILINGRSWKSIGFTPGGGEHFLDLSMELLESEGVITGTSRNQALWSYCFENDIHFNCMVTDGLKRDLFKEIDYTDDSKSSEYFKKLFPNLKGDSDE